jgi:hypothetical protein
LGQKAGRNLGFGKAKNLAKRQQGYKYEEILQKDCSIFTRGNTDYLFVDR